MTSKFPAMVTPFLQALVTASADDRLPALYDEPDVDSTRIVVRRDSWLAPRSVSGGEERGRLSVLPPN